ncbi:MAG: alpha/beta hydrolase [Sphingomonas sp.]
MAAPGMVRVPGAMLHVERRGAGDRPIVFIHGFGGDRTTWDGIWDALDPARATVRYDLRGFGGSIADAPEPFSHADDLAALLDALAIGRCDLVGLSMGGAVALDFALDRPGRVRRLVLVSPGVAGWDWSAEWRALWRPITAAARDGRMDEARDLWWRHPLFETTRAGPAATGLRRSIMAYAGAQWIADLQRPVLPAVERLHAITAPMLLLTGARDLPDFRLIADLLAAAAPDVRRVDMPGRGHLLHLEDPSGTIGRLAAFLTLVS